VALISVPSGTSTTSWLGLDREATLDCLVALEEPGQSLDLIEASAAVEGIDAAIQLTVSGNEVGWHREGRVEISKRGNGMGVPSFLNGTCGRFDTRSSWT